MTIQSAACYLCIYWNTAQRYGAFGLTVTGDWGECLRYPPQVVGVKNRWLSKGAGERTIYTAVYPATRANWRCGEFKSSEEGEQQ